MDLPSDTVAVLRRVVAVVPRGTELGGNEGVRSGLAWRNRALSDATNTIGVDAVQLSDTVEVDAGTVVLHGVLDVHNECVSPVAEKSWSGVLFVDKEALLETIAIRRTSRVGDFEVVGDCVTSGGVFLVKVCLDAVAVAPTGTGQRSVGTCCISNKRSR